MKTFPLLSRFSVRRSGSSCPARECSRRVGLLLAVGFCVAMAAWPVRGALRTWSGGSATSGYWTTGANWLGGVAPAAGDSLVFPSGASRLANTNNFTSGTVFAAISVAGSGYAIQGNQLGLSGGLSGDQAAGNSTFNPAIQLQASQSISVASGSALLILGGGVALNGHNLTVSGAGDTLISGVISGTGNVTKTGTGRSEWSGTGANTFSGTTTVVQGSLALGKFSLVGRVAIPGDLVIGDGSGGAGADVVLFQAHDQIANLSEVTVSSSGLLDLNGWSDAVGRIRLGAGQIDTGGGLLTIDGSIQQYATGTATIAGRLALGATTRVVDVIGAGVLRIDAAISGTGGLIKTNAGFVVLAGSNSFTGPFSLVGGYVEVHDPRGLGTTAGGTQMDGGVLRLVGVTVVGETLGASGGRLQGINVSNAWTGPVQITNTLGIEIPNAGQFLNLAGVVSGPGGISKIGPGTLILSGPSANTFAGDVAMTDGLLLLDKSATDGAVPGPGTLTIGVRSDAGESDIVRNLRGGQIGTTARIVVLDSGLLDLNNNSEGIGDIDLDAGYVRTGDGTLSLFGTLSATSTTNQTARMYGRLNLGSVARTFNIRRGAYLPELRIYASVFGSGAVVKTGLGWMGLSGSNNYSGLTTVSEGFVVMEDNHAAGTTNAGTVVASDGGLVVTSASHIAGESLSLTGPGPAGWFSLGVNLAVSSNSWSGPITIESPIDIYLGSTNSQLNLAGPISGAGGFTKTGPGTLILSGLTGNTYGGDTTVEEGLLALAKDAGTGVAIRNGRLTVGDGTGGANADVVRFRANNQLWSTVPIEIRSSGLLDLASYTDSLGDFTFSGGRVMTSASGLLSLVGGMTADNGNGFIDGRMSLGGVRTFNAADAAGANLYVTAQVLGSGGVTKTGPGQMYLYSSNSYEGLTTVSGGRVYADDNFSLGTTNGGVRVADGASLVLRYGVNVGIEPLVLDGVGEANLGALASIYGSNTWAGPITLGSNVRCTTLQASDVLGLDGPIAGGTVDVIIEGAGLTRYGGSGVNTYAGTTRVLSGTLLLAKSGANRAIAGDLLIGDGAGGAEADVVRLAASTQIANGSRVTIAGSGLLDLDGNGEAIDGLAGTGRVDLGDAFINIGTAGGSSTFDGQIRGTGTLGKLGAGTITFNGNNAYTGTTTITGGRLVVNGSQPGSAVNVNTGGTLAGGGTVGAVASTGGTVAPGASPGQLTMAGLVLDAASTCELELTGPVPGSLYDQINVTGTVNLGGATLRLNADALAAAEGDYFTLVANDGLDAMAGTFAGMPHNSVVLVGPREFRIFYNSGTGNDVMLRAEQPALVVAGILPQGGNGNGFVEPNECHSLTVSLYNVETNKVTGVSATLVCLTPGVTVSSARSGYPDIAPATSGSGLYPFQVSTWPTLQCGVELEFVLEVETASHGSFRSRFTIATGSAATPVNFAATDTPMAVVDNGSVTSVVQVTGIAVPIAKVTVSLQATHANLADLDVSLIGPDGTVVYLTADIGGASDNYGLACAEGQRTVFDDASGVAIGAAAPPFVGRFRPQWPLSAFVGLQGSAVNGPWKLRVVDDTAGNTGALNCWTLSLSPATCSSGSGDCDLCGDTSLAGNITTAEPDAVRPVLNGVASTCGVAKPCPGAAGGQSEFHAYPFYSGLSNACVTVTVSSPCPSSNALSSAAYLGSYSPLDVCAGYLADSGAGAFAETSRSYSFNVPARTNFWIVVQMVTDNAPCGEYVLDVQGADCRPALDIATGGSGRQVLSWPTYAPGYQLQYTNALGTSPQGFQTLTRTPVVISSRYVVTNSAGGVQGVYRLRK